MKTALLVRKTTSNVCRGVGWSARARVSNNRFLYQSASYMSRECKTKAEYEEGAALLEHYVCVTSPVEDESLSPDVAQGMSVSVRWPWRSGLHGAAGILVPDGPASRPQNRHCSTATADAAPLRRL